MIFTWVKQIVHTAVNIFSCLSYSIISFLLYLHFEFTWCLFTYSTTREFSKSIQRQFFSSRIIYIFFSNENAVSHKFVITWWHFSTAAKYKSDVYNSYMTYNIFPDAYRKTKAITIYIIYTVFCSNLLFLECKFILFEVCWDI